jgi:hypothetical protein
MIPSHNPLAAPVAPLIVPLGDIVYAPPAIAVTVAVPSHPGLQLGLVLAVIVITGEAGVVNNTVAVAEQLFASVTVTVYVMPAHNTLDAPVDGFIVPLGAILYTFVPFPPPDVNVAVPSHPGLQLGLVVVFTANVNCAGPTIVTDTVPTQLDASVPVIT